MQKAIHIFLFLWVGGLAPLIYMENFSSHRGVQTVQISLLKEPDSARLPIALRQIWAQRGSQWPTEELSGRPEFVVRHLALPGITSSLTGFYDKCWLDEMSLAGLIDPVPWGRVSGVQLTGCSMYLPPPEKPPPFPPRLIEPWRLG